MRRRILLLAAILLADSVVPVHAKAAKNFSPLRDQFRSPTPDNRPIVRWWWFGVAVTNEEIERELAQMRNAGFGGVEIQPVSAQAIFGPHDKLVNLPYLSREFLKALDFATAKAKDLGLTVDLALGSGWPLGGADVKPEHGARMVGGDPSRWPAGEPTREQTRGAAAGGEGLVLDPYDGTAVADHLRTVGDTLVSRKAALRAVFSDRPEAAGADWTSDFSAQFKRRHGYDLGSQLNSLTSNAADSADLRHDWAMTLSDLLDERFFAQLQDFARRHRLALRGDAIGSLPAPLSSARFFDIPEGDGAPWNGLTAMRWASSAAHAYGKSIAAAEAWRDAPPTFRASPLDLKIDADQCFLSGATQIVGHGWPYSPAQAGNPGWAFDTSAVVSAHNPWWPVMPELTMYLRRLSFALRQGDAVSDVAVYLPTHDAWAMLAPGNVDLAQALGDRVGPDLVPAILRAGYNFDLVDDTMVQNLAEASGKHLKIGRQQYSAIILPNVERIPLATLEKLDAFVAGGGTLIATRRIPSRLPDARAPKERSELLTAKLTGLFAGDNATLVHDELGELGGLLRRRLDPDLRTAMVAPQIGFVHRRTGDVDLYFLANTWNVAYTNTVEVRVAPRPAEWWDPMTGDMSPAVVASSSPRSTTVQVFLPAYGSSILVFGLSGRGRPPRALPGKLDPNAAPPASLDITHGWDVTFEGTVIRRQSDWLTSWTESADTRAFSGEAIYRKIVTVTQPKLLGARNVTLSLGEAKPSPPAQGPGERWVQARLESPVCVAAVVLVNGQRAGSVWHPPYAIDLGKRLREGENQIEIHVFNLGVNQLAGRPLGDYAWLAAKTGKPARATSEDPITPLPAGLVGPVTLVAAQ